MRWFYSQEDFEEEESSSFWRSLEHSGHSDDVYCTSYIIFDWAKQILCSNYIIKMKNFRSTKNLKPMDPQLKQQSQLRMKIKILEDQVSMLQKSNLNIFIPLSEHPVHETVDYQAIINKLRQQILSLEQENQGLKAQTKKLEKEKQQIKVKYQKEIGELVQKNAQLQEEVDKINQKLQELREQLDSKVKQCQEMDKKLIEKNVQLKFLHEDLHEQKIKRKSLEKELNDLKSKIGEVIFGSKVYKSNEVKCICIEKSEYEALKAKIAELEERIRAMIEASKREKVTLGTRKSDIGEEIVRLKKNIDVQLGIQGNSKHSEEFLKIYKGTNELLNELIFKYER